MIADAFADDLLTSLKIIGMVGADQKLCTRNGRLALNTSGAFWRWLTGDSRNHTLQAVRTAVIDPDRFRPYAHTARSPSRSSAKRSTVC